MRALLRTLSCCTTCIHLPSSVASHSAKRHKKKEQRSCGRVERMLRTTSGFAKLRSTNLFFRDHVLISKCNGLHAWVPSDEQWEKGV